MIVNRGLAASQILANAKATNLINIEQSRNRKLLNLTELAQTNLAAATNQQLKGAVSAMSRGRSQRSHEQGFIHRNMANLEMNKQLHAITFDGRGPDAHANSKAFGRQRKLRVIHPGSVAASGKGSSVLNVDQGH